MGCHLVGCSPERGGLADPVLLLGFTGPRAEAEEIKQRLAEFLRDELTVELPHDKTPITRARTGAADPSTWTFDYLRLATRYEPHGNNFSL